MKSAALFLVLFAAPLAAQLYVPFDDLELLSSGVAHVTLNGSAVLGEPDAVLTVNQNAAGVVKGITASVSLDGALTLEITADAAGAFSETLPIVALPLPTSTLGTNVDVAPWAIMLLTVSGDAAFGMRTSFVQSFNVHADVALGPGFHVTASKGPSMSLAGQPDIAAGSSANIQVSTTLAVVYLLTAGGLPLGGPFAGVTLGADANIDPLADPWWEVDGSMDILAGYWGLGIAPLVFPVGIFDFGQADGPLIGAPPTTRWGVAIDADPTDSTRGVVPTAGGFLLAGRRALGDPVLARLGPDGALLSAEVSTAATNGGGQKIVCTEPTVDGGLVQGGDGAGGVRVDRLDAGGAMVWSKVYTHAASIVPGLVDLVAMADGGFAVLGRIVLTSSTSVARPFVLRLDADGNVLWARDLFLGGSDPSASAYDLAPTADGGLLLTGAVGYNEVHGSQLALFANNLLLARLEADGDLAFAHVIGTTGNEQGNSVAEGPGGTIWMGGGITEGPSTWAWVSTFSADGTLGWSRKLRGQDTGIFGVPVRTLVPIEGGAALLGDRGLGNGHDAWLGLITNGATPVMWQGLGGAAEDAPLGLRVLPDGLLLWGWTRSLDALSGTGADHWVLRTSVDGLLHFDPALGFSASIEKPDWDFPSGDLEYALLLSPSVQSATFTVTDKPLPFVTLPASETVLTE